MDTNLILDKLNFAKKYDIAVQIISRKGKSFSAKILKVSDNQILWDFANNASEETDAKPMNVSNIFDLIMQPSDEFNFQEYRQCTREEKQSFRTVQQNFEQLFEYYQKVLEEEKKETETKQNIDEKEREIELCALENKRKVLEAILQYRKVSEQDLLLPFVRNRNYLNEIPDAQDRPILLLKQANCSQKTAIERVLSQKVSFIEGPPGTGKTTTILSVIANLLYRNQKIVIVSKNNSAINNIAEELDKLNLSGIYVRLGNNQYTNDLFRDILQKIDAYQKSMKSFAGVVQPDLAELNKTYDDIREKEKRLNSLVNEKNKLAELENQKRHLEKRQKAYHETFSGRLPYWLRFCNLDKLRTIADQIAKLYNKYCDNINREISVWDSFVAFLVWGIRKQDFTKQILLLLWELESRYLSQQIKQIAEIIADSNFKQLQDEVNNSYRLFYIEKSEDLLKKALFEYYNNDQNVCDCLISKIKIFQKKYKQELQSNSGDGDFLAAKSEILKELTEFFPLSLTTADSLATNYYEYRFGKKKFDYIIMDEATQCDVITGIPVLFYAKRCVISGDSKQLSAITGKQKVDVDKDTVCERLQYYNNDFLKATKESFGVEPTLLREHYRCDYNIINYCNQFFYDNELIIYPDASIGAMQLLNVDKGKYVVEKNNSFSNDREAYTILQQCAGDLDETFVITPFKKQKELLKSRFPEYKNNCGTIHSFQGRGEKKVYFSTVLNDLRVCNNHLASDHNLFTPELVNVAVSRAKNNFILVTDKVYFSAHSDLVQQLILYIEKYGKVIPDKTVCLFDHLYKEMKTYTASENCSNPFERAVLKSLKDFCEVHRSYRLLVKMPLANLVTDKNYLDTHNKIRRFVLNERTHVDFVIANRLGNPVVAIELDGQDHEKEEQKRRDKMKNQALEHMQIPLIRLSSKEAFSQNEFHSFVSAKIEKQPSNMQAYKTE